jgi:isopenicillin N synthase-like dioxygenase
MLHVPAYSLLGVLARNRPHSCADRVIVRHCRRLHASTRGDTEIGVIPVVEVGSLLAGDATAWMLADRDLYTAAREVGFAYIRGLQGDEALGPAARARLLTIFDLNDAQKRRL